MNTATDMLSPLERLLGLPTQAEWDAGMGLNPKKSITPIILTPEEEEIIAQAPARNGRHMRIRTNDPELMVLDNMLINPGNDIKGLLRAWFNSKRTGLAGKIITYPVSFQEMGPEQAESSGLNIEHRPKLDLSERPDREVRKNAVRSVVRSQACLPREMDDVAVKPGFAVTGLMGAPAKPAVAKESTILGVCLAKVDAGTETVLTTRLERELLAQSRRGNVDLGDDFDTRLQQEVDDHHGVSLDEIFREHGKRLEQFCVAPRIGDSPEIVGYFQDIPMTRDQDGHLIALEPGQHLGMSEAAIEDYLGIKEQPAGSGMLSALPLTPVRSEPKAMKIPYPTLGDYLKPVPLPSPTKLQLFISKLFYPEPKQVFEPYRPLKKQNGRLYIDDCPHFQEKIQDTPAKRALMFLRDVPDQISYDLLALKGLSTIIVDAVVDESGTLSPNAIRELEQEGYFILYNTHGYLDKDNNRHYLLHLHCERFQAVLMESIDPLFGD